MCLVQVGLLVALAGGLSVSLFCQQCTHDLQQSQTACNGLAVDLTEQCTRG